MLEGPHSIVKMDFSSLTLVNSAPNFYGSVLNYLWYQYFLRVRYDNYPDFLKKIYTKLYELNAICFSIGIYPIITATYSYSIYAYYYIDEQNKIDIDNLVGI